MADITLMVRREISDVVVGSCIGKEKVSCKTQHTTYPQELAVPVPWKSLAVLVLQYTRFVIMFFSKKSNAEKYSTQQFTKSEMHCIVMVLMQRVSSVIYVSPSVLQLMLVEFDANNQI